MFEIQKVTYKRHKKNRKNLGYTLKEVLIAAARKLRGARRIWRNSRWMQCAAPTPHFTVKLNWRNIWRNIGKIIWEIFWRYLLFNWIGEILGEISGEISEETLKKYSETDLKKSQCENSAKLLATILYATLSDRNAVHLIFL